MNQSQPGTQQTTAPAQIRPSEDRLNYWLSENLGALVTQLCRAPLSSEDKQRLVTHFLNTLRASVSAERVEEQCEKREERLEINTGAEIPTISYGIHPGSCGHAAPVGGRKCSLLKGHYGMHCDGPTAWSDSLMIPSQPFPAEEVA